MREFVKGFAEGGRSGEWYIGAARRLLARIDAAAAADARDVRARYHNDPLFHYIVNGFRSAMQAGTYTAQDVRQAVDLAEWFEGERKRRDAQEKRGTHGEAEPEP